MLYAVPPARPPESNSSIIDYFFGGPSGTPVEQVLPQSVSVSTAADGELTINHDSHDGAFNNRNTSPSFHL